MNSFKFFMFIFLFFFNNLLLAFQLKQVVICEDNIISSFFATNDSCDNNPFELKNFADEETEIYIRFLFCENDACNIAEAQILFNEILLRKDIPFDYTDDGCFARAHVIADYLFNKGIKTGKIWLMGNNIINPSDNSCKWDYHVAATIEVKLCDNSDNSETLVIDPSPVNKKLLTINEWLSLHKIINYPPIVYYPLPSDNLELTLICLSSHLAFYPFKIDLTFSWEENLEEAKDVNLDNLNYVD